MTVKAARSRRRACAVPVLLALVTATGWVPTASAAPAARQAQADDLTPEQAELLRRAQAASALFDTGDYAGAEAGLTALIPLMAQMFGETSLGMSKLQVDLGDARRAQGKHAEAAAAYAAALKIRQDLRRQPPLEVEAIVYSLAGSQWAAGQLMEAAASYHQAAFIRENELGARHTATADALLNFSLVESARGRIVTALEAAEKAWSIHSENEGERSIPAMESLRALGVARQAAGLWTEAEADFRKVIALRRELTPDDEAGLANALGDLGSVLIDLGRYAEAEPLQIQALEIQRRVWGPGHANVWWALSDYANAVYSRALAGRPEAALRRIIAGGGATADSDDPDARLLHDRFAAAETLYREALTIAREGHGAASAQTGVSLANLANVLAAQGRFAESEPLNHEALAVYDALYGLNHPNLAVTRTNLGDTLRALGRHEEALDQHKWAGVIAQVLYGAEHAIRAQISHDVGIDQLMMGDVEVGAYSLGGATSHRMRQVCPAGDRGERPRHRWSYADPDCAGAPDFTASVATFAGVRMVFEDRPAAALRMVSHAGDMVLGRTRLRYALFDDARTEAGRFTYVHRQFVSTAWALSDTAAREQVSADLDRFHWPYRRP